MSGNYITRYTQPENLYVQGAPVLITAGSLLQDTETGRAVVQLAFKSLSTVPISSVRVELFAFDGAAQPVGSWTPYVYANLQASAEMTFGGEQSLGLPDAASHSFAVRVSQVVLADGTVWTGGEGPWQPLPAQPEPQPEPAQPKPKKKRTRLIITLTIVAVAVVGLLLALFLWLIPTLQYNQAMSLIKKGQHTEAYELLQGAWGEQNEELRADFVPKPGKIVSSSADGSRIVYEIKYDGYGNATRRRVVDADGSVGTEEGDHEYDEDGNLIESIYRDSDGYTRTYEYEYDKDGNCVEETYRSSDGGSYNYSYTTEYEYDKNGNLVEKSWRSSNGATQTIECEYDEDGNCVEKTYRNGDGDISITEYKYDEGGNRVKETSRGNDGDTSTIEYEYNVDGNLVEKTYRNGDGDASTTEYQYAEDGNLTQETYRNGDGGTRTIEYKYDKDGNLEKVETSYGGKVTVSGWEMFYDPELAELKEEAGVIAYLSQFT